MGGQGNFSVVYMADCIVDNNRKVALKKVQIFEMTDQKARQDCIKEIELLKSLNHPNVGVGCYISIYTMLLINIITLRPVPHSGHLLPIVVHREQRAQHCPCPAAPATAAPAIAGIPRPRAGTPHTTGT